MKIVFRVDSSLKMGVGHLVRCLTLAEALRDRGADVTFVTRDHAGNVAELLRERVFDVRLLALPETRTNDSNTDDYAAWLAVTQAKDARDAAAELGGEKPDWLIVDQYGLDEEWERALRPLVDRLMVIDDLANRVHDCDVLLDQNYTVDGARRYDELVPPTTRMLLGPHFALLRPEYAECRRRLHRRIGDVRRILVYLGGPDPDDTTSQVLDALSEVRFCDIEVDVIVGANNPRRAALDALVRARPRTRVAGPVPHLADLLSKADLVIGAGGGTTWERMCLGAPSIVVSVSDNQRPSCDALAAAGWIDYLGDRQSMSVEQLREGIARLVADRERRSQLSRAGRSLVDGLGVHRVCEVLMPTTSGQLHLRGAVADDAQVYFDWVNNRETRAQSHSTAPISWTEHQAWFERCLADPSCHLLVLMSGPLPVGQIRFDFTEDEVWIDYSLDPLVRGRGWGTALLTMGSAVLRKQTTLPILGEVKAANIASRAAFFRAGFALDASRSRDGVDVFVSRVAVNQHA